MHFVLMLYAAQDNISMYICLKVLSELVFNGRNASVPL